MTDADIKLAVYEHTKLNPNQADDQVLLDGIVRAVRQLTGRQVDPLAEVCGNCDTALPGGCGGLFSAEGACKWRAEQVNTK